MARENEIRAKHIQTVIEKDSTAGITLVALVVTIIVLIILAGVSISTLIGNNGIVKKATETQILTELSTVKESLNIYKLSKYKNTTNEDLVEEGLLKEVFINETYRTIGIITDLNKIEVDSKLGKGGAKQEETEVNTLLDLYNVYGIDMEDGTLYYIRDGIWSIDGKKVTYVASTGEEKEGYVVETINQTYLENSKFITEWTVEAGTTVTLPITVAPDITIEWGSDDDGDGEEDIEECTTVSPTHTYTNAGTYTIKISGTMPDWLADSNTYITGIKQWGNVEITEIRFKNCTNLSGTIPSHKTEGEFALLKTANSMFRECTNLTGNIPEDLFEEAEKITTFEWCFYKCSGLVGEIPKSLFEKNTEVTSFERTFNGCEGLSGKIPEGLFKNCSKVTTFAYAFRETQIEEIPANLFDINNGQANGIKNMDGVFGNTKLKSIPSGLFDLCTEVEYFGHNGYNYGGIFENCTDITVIPEGLFDNCTKVKDMSRAFVGCSSLESIPEDLFAKNTGITTFYKTFGSCTKITEIPEGLFDENTKVTIFSETFNNCSSITSIPSGLFDNNTQVTKFNSTFMSCKSLTQIPEGLFNNNTQVESFSSTFRGAGITEIPKGLFDNNTQVETFEKTFMECKSITEIPEGLFDNNTEVTSFVSTFWYCYNLTGQAPELWNRTNVTSSEYCFNGCTKLDNYADIPDGWK